MKITTCISTLLVIHSWIAIVVLLLLLFVCDMIVAVQTNDVCTGAESITIGRPFTVITHGATIDVNVVDNCFDGTPPDSLGVWFTFIGNGNRLVAQACNWGLAALAIYKGGCDPLQLQCVAAAYDCDRKFLVFDTILGVKYHVLIQSPYYAEFHLSIFPIPEKQIVRNDKCIDAQPVTIGTKVTADATYATRYSVVNDIHRFDPRPHYPGVLDFHRFDRRPDYPGVWFKFTGTGERLIITASESSDVFMFEGECDPSQLPSVDTLIHSDFVFDAIQGTKYHVLVQLSLFEEGIVALSIFPLPTVPRDICTNAHPITIGSKATTNTEYTALDMTVVPVDNCLNGRHPSIRGVWFNFTGTGERLVAQSWPRTNWDISIYKGECDASQLQCVTDSTDPTIERLVFDTVRGSKYRVLVQTHIEGIVGLSIFPVPTIVCNDKCINAQPFSLGSNVTMDPTYARIDTSVVVKNETSPNYPGLWFNFIGTGERLVIRSCLRRYVSIYIYTGECDLSQLQYVAGTSYLCELERFSFDTILGTKYHVLVQSYYEGIVDLSIFPRPSVTNDICTNAQPFTIGSNVTINATYATIDTSVSYACQTGLSPSYPGVWFNFTGTGERLVTHSSFGSSFSIYTGECDPSQLQCVPGISESQGFVFDTIHGTKYRVLVQSYDEGIVDLSIFPRHIATNVICNNTQPIRIGTSVTASLTYAITATTVIDNCYNGQSPSHPGIWFNFTGTGERIVARSCFGSYISIYMGECDLSQPQCVAGTSNPCGRERFIFDTVRGNVYKVLVQSPSIREMDFTFLVQSPSIREMDWRWSPYDKNLIDLSIFPLPVVPNDICKNAQPITIGSSVIMNVTYATTDTTVTNDCLNGQPPSSPGVWFNFNGTGERLVARACSYTSGVNISIYIGDCGALQLKCVAATANPCGQKRFMFDTIQGTKYNVLVQSHNEGMLDLLIFPLPIESYDKCINAQPFTIGSRIVTNTTYTITDRNVLESCFDGISANIDRFADIYPVYYPGVWFNFTGTGQRLVARSCWGVSTSIYKGDCVLSQLQCIAGAFDVCKRERFIFDTVKGANYHILVQSYTEREISLSIFPLPSSVTNDICTNAQPFTIGSSVTIDATYATSDTNVASCFDDEPPSDSPGVWFNFTGTGERLVARSCPINFNKQSISIYKGECDVSQLQCVAATKMTCVEKKRFVFDTIQGTKYHVLVQSYNEEFLNLFIFSLGNTITQKPTNVPFPVPIADIPFDNTTRTSTKFLFPVPAGPVPTDNQTSKVTRPIVLSNILGDLHITTLDGFVIEYNYCRMQWCVRKSTDSLFTFDSGVSRVSYCEIEPRYSRGVIKSKSLASASLEIRTLCGTNIRCVLDGIVGTILDAESLLNDTDRIHNVMFERNITYKFYETTPTIVPTASPTSVPTTSPTYVPSISPTLAPKSSVSTYQLFGGGGVGASILLSICILCFVLLFRTSILLKSKIWRRIKDGKVQ